MSIVRVEGYFEFRGNRVGALVSYLVPYLPAMPTSVENN